MFVQTMQPWSLRPYRKTKSLATDMWSKLHEIFLSLITKNSLSPAKCDQHQPLSILGAKEKEKKLHFSPYMLLRLFCLFKIGGIKFFFHSRRKLIQPLLNMTLSHILTVKHPFNNQTETGNQIIYQLKRQISQNTPIPPTYTWASTKLLSLRYGCYSHPKHRTCGKWGWNA